MGESKETSYYVTTALFTVVVFAGIIALVGGIVYALLNEPNDKDTEIFRKDYGMLRTMEINGEKHQYIFADRGICHLPNCKYCKPVSIHPSDFR